MISPIHISVEQKYNSCYSKELYKISLLIGPLPFWYSIQGFHVSTNQQNQSIYCYTDDKKQKIIDPILF
jgi:hypothetical protein